MKHAGGEIKQHTIQSIYKGDTVIVATLEQAITIGADVDGISINREAHHRIHAQTTSTLVNVAIRDTAYTKKRNTETERDSVKQSGQEGGNTQIQPLGV